MIKRTILIFLTPFLVLCLTQSAFADEYTKLLLHCDDGTDFEDSSILPHNVAPIGTPLITTAPTYPQNNAAFGAACKFDGNGDYLSIPDIDNWDFGTEPFTIDFWMKLSTISKAAGFVRLFSDSSNRVEIGYYDGYDAISFRILSGGEYVVNMYHQNWPGKDTDWHHIACVRSGDTFSIYLDGSLLQSSIWPQGVMPHSADGLRVGMATDSGLTDLYLDGYIDEFRISKGDAR